MKKLVIKTILITLACIVGAGAFLYGVFAIFFPRNLATTFDQLDFYSPSIHYYQKSYDKSHSLDDLYTLCSKLDIQKSSELSKQYCQTLCESDDFQRFCDDFDKKSSGNISTKDFIQGKYVCSLFYCNQFDDALSKCQQFVQNDGYTKYGCFNFLIGACSSEFSAQQKSQLKNLLLSIKDGFTVGSVDYDNVCLDISLLD